MVSLAQGDDKTDFWLAELSSSTTMAAALKLEKPAKLDLAIDLDCCTTTRRRYMSFS